MHNAFLIGTGIYLRPLEPEDMPTLAKWLARSEVQTALDLFYRLPDQSAKESLGFFIGEQSPNTEEYEAEAVHLVAEYAFETLDMNHIWLHVDACDNHAIRRLKKAGFSYEATLRQDRYDERYFDTVVMGLWQRKAG